MSLILSTKKLKPNQRDLLLGAGFSLVDYDAITIKYLKTELPATVKNAIFTSKNGVQSVEAKIAIENCFCVGEKTKALLEENGQKVIEMGLNSKELAHKIAKKYKNEAFHYFCGTERREELPSFLKSEKINIFELKTYKTELKLQKFHQKWDGILFFSPSGISSFINENMSFESQKHDCFAFCIGETTAQEAKKHFSNVIVANTTRIESVIAKAIKTLHS